MDFQYDLKQAIEVLRKGGLILYPTDTIWGIGCDATNSQAVQRVYDLKKRTDSKSMLVLLDNVGRLISYVQEVPSLAYDLIEVTDKPLTIIYPGAKNLASNLSAADGSIGIRVTNEAFSKALCRQFRKALVSTSANVSGEPSPRSFSEISDEIRQGVDYVVNYRQEEDLNPAPSGIIQLGVGGEIKVIRE